MEDGQRDGSTLLFMAILVPGIAMGKGARKLLEMETAHHSKAIPGLFMDATVEHSWLLQSHQHVPKPHLGGGTSGSASSSSSPQRSFSHQPQGIPGKGEEKKKNKNWGLLYLKLSICPKIPHRYP